MSEVPFVVLYDANVLYPSTIRDLLIRVVQTGLVQARWTDQILDEVFDNLTANRPDLDPQGRSHGHHRAPFVTATGQVSRPPLGRTQPALDAATRAI